MKKCHIFTVLMIAIAGLSGCQYVPTVSQKQLSAVYEKKATAQSQIDALNAQHTTDLTNNLNQLSTTKDTVINGQKAQIQAGANALYTVQKSITAIPAPGAFEFTRDRAIEGFTALGLPPTLQEINDGTIRLQQYETTYKNGQQADIQTLEAEHDALVKQNGILVTTTQTAVQQVAAIQLTNTQIQTKFIADSAVAQKNLNDANNNVITTEKKRGDAEATLLALAQSAEKLKRTLMMWCAIAAALCLVAGIYSPIGKEGLIILAIAFGGAAAAIPFIQAWMVLVAVIIVVLGVVGYLLYKHYVADKTSTNLVNAVEDTKQTPNATLATLMSNIAQWNTTYTKASGSITTVPDAAVEQYIQSILIKTGRLVGITPAPTPTPTLIATIVPVATPPPTPTSGSAS